VSPPTSEVQEIEELLGAAASTVDLLLLRWPGLSPREVGRRVERLLRAPSRPPLAIHARFDLALALGVEGVHLPERELEPEWVRRHVGSLCVGVSRHDAEGLSRAVGADYATLSPFAPTVSKPGVTPLPRAEFARACREAPLPVLALGGVCEENTRDALGAGAHGIALISGVFGRRDPVAALMRLRGILDGPGAV